MCAAKVCNFPEINSNKKAAIGQCVSCGHVEYFTCAGVSQELKDDVSIGKIKYC